MKPGEMKFSKERMKDVIDMDVVDASLGAKFVCFEIG